MENTPSLAAPESPRNAPDASGVRLCIQAALAVARRPSRATFATRMRVIEPAWIPRLLVVVVALDMLSGLAGLVVSAFIATPSASPADYLFGVPSLMDRFIYALIVVPLTDVLALALIVFGAALLKPAGQEQVSVRARAREVLRPYLLAEGVVASVLLLIGQPVAALQVTGIGQSPLAFLLTGAASLAILIYTVVALLNALAAGSGVSRWLLIVVLVLGVAVAGAIGWFGLGALLALVGIHLPL